MNDPMAESHKGRLRSVVSYPERGSYGHSKFRGNCSGYLAKDLMEYFRPKRVLDPMEVSGTTGDVCNELGIEYAGLDPRKGFNLPEDEVRALNSWIVQTISEFHTLTTIFLSLSNHL